MLPQQYCAIEYTYAAGAWYIGSGFAVYVDDPTLTNPDDWWEPPVGFPPSTVGPGQNKEGAGECDGSQHTITFVVWPGTVLHLDGFDTECTDVVDNNERSWGTIKALYR